ncbi:MAG TPA: 50S ribosomal protein L4 [archaeon]|nr:50S ribosomal protein L4 [archaeon]
MVKASVYTLAGEAGKEIELPTQFSEALRPDVIHRAVLAVQSAKFQPKGNYYNAGRDYTAEFEGRRRRIGQGNNIGRARLPRLKNVNRHAGYMGDVMEVPQARHGPRAHPPKVEKVLIEGINKNERRLAIRSAIAATRSKELARGRGHDVGALKELPVIVVDDFEKLDKTSKVEEVLQKLGVLQDVVKAKQKTSIRAGKGKTRGRKYKERKGPLVVVSQKCQVIGAAKNLPGVDVVEVRNLNAELLAPGTHAGRLSVWSQAAVERLSSGKLFS